MRIFPEKLATYELHFFSAEWIKCFNIIFFKGGQIYMKDAEFFLNKDMQLPPPFPLPSEVVQIQ